MNFNSNRDLILGARITGIGTYRPKKIIDNLEIAKRINSSDEWIRERSGIIERRVAGPNESVAFMAYEASKLALENAQITSEEIDLIILATSTNPAQLPNLAMEVAGMLTSKSIGAFDVGAACSGFTYALAMANSTIRSGGANNVLVIGTEKMTDITNPYDRGTAFLFADGAGAFVVSKSQSMDISNPVWGSQGQLKNWIRMSHNWIEPNDGEDVHKTQFGLVMEGQKVFRWAISEMPKIAQQILDEAGVKSSDLGAFIPHQANLRITDHIAKSLNLSSRTAIARDGVLMGNTSAASIPLALDTLIKNKEVISGQLALLLGFGAGLAYCGQVVVVP